MKRILLILALAVSVFTIGATSQPQPKSWEYKFEYKVNEKKANELSTAGWELVGVGNDGGSLNSPFLVFRRVK